MATAIGIPSLRGVFSGKQVDSVRKETHVVSVMIQRLETDVVRDQGQSSSPAPKAQAQTDGKIPQEVQVAEGKSFWNMG